MIETIIDIVKWYPVFIVAYIARMLLAYFWLVTLHNRFPRLRPYLKIPGGIFIVLDVVLNYALIPYFMNFNRQWDETVSSRLARYKIELKPAGWGFNRWRSFNGWMFCKILSAADKNHCYNNYRSK